MRFVYHPDALLEYADAALYYDERAPGLGSDFTTEVDAAIKRILEGPKQWACLEEDVRRCLVHRFPYGILYTIEEEYVLIVAIMHLSREPGYWRHRIPRNETGA